MNIVTSEKFSVLTIFSKSIKKLIHYDNWEKEDKIYNNLMMTLL